MCSLAYTPQLLLVHDCDQPTTLTSSSHVHSPLGLAAAVSALLTNNLEQTSTGSAKQENSLNICLRAGYLSVRTAGGASDGRSLRARRMDLLTYLLTYLPLG